MAYGCSDAVFAHREIVAFNLSLAVRVIQNVLGSVALLS